MRWGGRTYTGDHASTGSGRASLGVVAVASVGLAGRDVVEGTAGVEVDERVQEAERRLAGAQAGVVEEGNDAGGDWGGRRGTSVGAEDAAEIGGVPVGFVLVGFMAFCVGQRRLTKGRYCVQRHQGNLCR